MRLEGVTRPDAICRADESTKLKRSSSADSSTHTVDVLLHALACEAPHSLARIARLPYRRRHHRVEGGFTWRTAAATRPLGGRNRPQAHPLEIAKDIFELNHPTALVRSSVLIEYRRLALALGLDALDLMARANISQSYLEDRELTLPMSAVVDLFEITAHSSGIQDFGIRLAEMRGLPDLGLITLMLREETDVRTALKSLTAMLHLHSDALYMYLDERGRDPFLSIDIIGPNIGNCRQAIEASVGGGTAILRWLLGSHWNPAQVCFRHDRPHSTAKHEQLFRCPISFTADFNGVVLHATDVQRKLPPTSPVFRRHIERLVHGLAQSSSESYVHRVNQVVTMLLPQGDATAANSARLLGTSSRTLHRNLARAKTNFTKLLDQLRRDRVMQCMANRDQSLTDIAGQMGFGSLSAFSRWFVDAFGQSPRDWRKDQIGHI